MVNRFVIAPGRPVKKITFKKPIDICGKVWYIILVLSDSEKVTESVTSLFCGWSATLYERAASQSANLVEASYRWTLSGGVVAPTPIQIAYREETRKENCHDNHATIAPFVISGQNIEK